MIVPLEDLRNDRAAIIAIVSEWYLYPKIKNAEIRNKEKLLDGHLLSKRVHGAWVFWYDEIQNVIYL